MWCFTTARGRAGQTAFVFATGSMQWIYGLDDWVNVHLYGGHSAENATALRLTQNVLRRVLGA